MSHPMSADYRRLRTRDEPPRSPRRRLLDAVTWPARLLFCLFIVYLVALVSRPVVTVVVTAVVALVAYLAWR